MTSRSRFVSSAAVLLTLATVALTPLLAGGDKSDLAARVEAWEAAFNESQPGDVARLYTEDAMRLPYQAAALEGRSAIRDNIKATYAAGITGIKLTATGSETKGSMAWGHGTYALLDGNGDVVQEGKWMNVSKKVAGVWLIHCDIWNTDAPD